MVRYVTRIGVIALIAALLLSTTLVVHANEFGDTTDIAVDLLIRGGSEVDIHATGGSELDVSIREPGEAHIYIGDDPKTVIDIHITGHGEVDVEISGACMVNLKIEGPSEVHIDAGDEVDLNIEASDESQVFLDDQSLDNPAQKPDEPAQGSVVPVISGIFPAAGLLAFFLIRRRAQNKVKNERR
ncbi:hypothetical protein ES708_26003 [subsurface metagenome]